MMMNLQNERNSQMNKNKEKILTVEVYKIKIIINISPFYLCSLLI